MLSSCVKFVGCMGSYSPLACNNNELQVHFLYVLARETKRISARQTHFISGLSWTKNNSRLTNCWVHFGVRHSTFPTMWSHPAHCRSIALEMLLPCCHLVLNPLLSDGMTSWQPWVQQKKKQTQDTLRRKLKWHRWDLIVRGCKLFRCRPEWQLCAFSHYYYNYFYFLTFHSLLSCFLWERIFYPMDMDSTTWTGATSSNFLFYTTHLRRHTHFITHISWQSLSHTL